MTQKTTRSGPEPASLAPRPALRALVGPTGVGKSDLALALAGRAGAEILAMDSMQVYRGLDVGTAKPTAKERAACPHHLIDLAAPGESFTVVDWLAAARAAEGAVRERGARPLYVGGTAFYLKALVAGIFAGPEVDPQVRAGLEQRAEREGLAALHAELARVDPRSAARIHPHDGKRLIRALEVHAQTGRPLSAWQTTWGFHGAPADPAQAGDREPGPRRHLVGLTRPTAELDRRIRARSAAMLDSGWPEEVRALRAAGWLSKTAAQALGYAEVLALVEGRLDRAACLERIALRTRQFARRQRTWLRRFEDLVWVDLGTSDDPDEHSDLVLRGLGWA